MKFFLTKKNLAKIENDLFLSISVATNKFFIYFC